VFEYVDSHLWLLRSFSRHGSGVDLVKSLGGVPLTVQKLADAGSSVPRLRDACDDLDLLAFAALGRGDRTRWFEELATSVGEVSCPESTVPGHSGG
jgi:hypothetical protein